MVVYTRTSNGAIRRATENQMKTFDFSFKNEKREIEPVISAQNWVTFTVDKLTDPEEFQLGIVPGEHKVVSEAVKLPSGYPQDATQIKTESEKITVDKGNYQKFYLVLEKPEKEPDPEPDPASDTES